jgi:hypothetical protein
VTVGVYGDDLLVRIDPDAIGAALANPACARFTMGGRATRGFIVVAGDALDDSTLDSWITQADTYVATLPRK